MSDKEAERFFEAMAGDARLLRQWVGAVQKTVNLAHSLGFRPPRPTLWGSSFVTALLSTTGFECSGNDLDTKASYLEAELGGGEFFAIEEYGIVRPGKSWKRYVRKINRRKPFALVKQVANQVLKTTPFCGKLWEILRRGDYRGLDVAVLEDVNSTVGHFHRGFDEIYFQLDGTLTVTLFDPNLGADTPEQIVTLARNELCVIPRGVHHKVSRASRGNRLCCICVPSFDPADETRSEQLEAVPA